MKSILKTLFLFLIFVFTLAFVPQGESFSDAQYLQNETQKVFVVSNSIFGGEIVAAKGNNSSSGSLNNSQISNVFFKDDVFIGTPTRLDREFIHNLSTNFENEISGRAPPFCFADFV